MLSIFSKKKYAEDCSYFPIANDIHSHILPGIDDGSPDLETSITLIKGLMELGITKSVATPHIISDLYRNDSTTINNALSLLNNELKNQEITFDVTAAAEYMMDSYFLELLRKEEKLLTIKDNIVLTEFSYASMPDDPGLFSFAIITAGYKPILAHPERYPYYYGNNKAFHRLVELGFSLQLNILSLTGYYGKEAAKVSEYLLKNDLISYIGTDLHHDRHLAALTNPSNRKLFEKHLGHREWNF